MLSASGNRARVYEPAASRRRVAVVFWLHSRFARSARMRRAQPGTSAVIRQSGHLHYAQSFASSHIPFPPPGEKAFTCARAYADARAYAENKPLIRLIGTRWSVITRQLLSGGYLAAIASAHVFD